MLSKNVYNIDLLLSFLMMFIILYKFNKNNLETWSL